MTTDNQDTAELAKLVHDIAHYTAKGKVLEGWMAEKLLRLHASISHPAPSHPATTAGGWISVGDGLPEPGTECLVWVRSLYTTPGKYYATVDTWDEQREAPLSFSSATIPVGLGWNDHEFDDVSHWQPIAPPAITNTGGTE